MDFDMVGIEEISTQKFRIRCQNGCLQHLDLENDANELALWEIKIQKFGKKFSFPFCSVFFVGRRG